MNFLAEEYLAGEILADIADCADSADLPAGRHVFSQT